MRRGRVALGVLLSSAVVLAQQPGERPAFRSGVDVLSIDVQVVDAAGHPVKSLGADAFSVTIGGKRRRVISADFVSAHGPSSTMATPSGSHASAPNDPVSDDGPTYFLTIDCLSFGPVQAAAVTRTARTFVSRLGPNERVGLFAYPSGPKVEATTHHADVLAALDQIHGQNDPPAGFTSENRPRPQDIVDATSPAGSRDSPFYRVALAEESQNTASIGMLSAFVRGLGALPGRKIVILISSGLISADVPGYRPDLGERAIGIGHEAAASNATVYALFVDQTFLTYGSFQRRVVDPGNTRKPIQRDSQILNRYLDQVSGASGGAMLTSLTDDGTAAFNRILEETSSYYLLAVEAEKSDRDGRPHALAVKTAEHGATVRARSSVMIPKPGN